MNLEKTGEIILNARKKLNLTQNELGEKIGVTGKAVSKWEKGYSFPDVGVLSALSDALSIPIAVLVSGNLEETPSEKNDKEIVEISTKQSKRKRKIIIGVCVPVAIILVAVIVVLSFFLHFSLIPPSTVKKSSFRVSAFGSDGYFETKMHCYIGIEEAYGDCGLFVFTKSRNYQSIINSIESEAKEKGFVFDKGSSLLYKKNQNGTIDYYIIERVNSSYNNILLYATGLSAHLYADDVVNEEPVVATDILIPVHMIEDNEVHSPYIYIPSHAEYRVTRSFDEICSFYKSTGYFTVTVDETQKSATVVSNSNCAKTVSFAFDYAVHSGFSYISFYNI